MCAGCAQFGDPSARIETARQIPVDCESEARPVVLPDPRAGADARLEAARNRQAAVTANKRLTVTRDCQKKQREEFAR